MKIGWLSPTGEFIECGLYDHSVVAEKLTGDPVQPDEILFKRGYAKITVSMLGKKEQAIFWDLHRDLTPEQVRFLRPYFEENDLPLTWATRYRWEQEVL